jgi:hypothetical protein
MSTTLIDAGPTCCGKAMEIEKRALYATNPSKIKYHCSVCNKEKVVRAGKKSLT